MNRKSMLVIPEIAPHFAFMEIDYQEQSHHFVQRTGIEAGKDRSIEGT